jgi:hypothetical protein
MKERAECSRRHVLRAGVMAGTASAALGSAGCAGWGVGSRLRAPTAALSRGELAAFLEQFDRGLLLIERSEFVTRFAEARGPAARTVEERRWLEEAEADFRDTIASIFASQSFRELPLESQLHPEVQRRMLGRIESIDATVRRLSRRLRELSPAEREAFHDALQKSPELSMDISEAMNREASRVGVSPALRRHFRWMMTQVAFRITSQGPTRALDDITAHLDRVQAPGGVHYAQARALAQGDPDDFLGPAGAALLRSSPIWSELQVRSGWVERWAADPEGMGERLAAAARRRALSSPAHARRRPVSQRAPRTSADQSPESRRAHSERARRKRRRDRRMLFIGALLLGLGLVVSAAGAVAVGSIGLGGAFVVTPGAMAAATGLVLLLVGAARMGRAP